MLKKTLLAVGIFAIAAGPCFATDFIELSVLGKVGYSLPLGEWTSHRYAPGIDQFQGGYTVSPEVGIRFRDLGISIMYTYSGMSTKEWEDYVGGQGESLSASGSLSQLGGVIQYYFVRTDRSAAHIEGGLSYVFLRGDEQYRGFSYEYDFLKSGLGFLAGAGYQYAFNEQLSVVFPVRFLWRPEGIKYPEGKTYDIFGLLFMPGLKLTF
jgi:opacity protein-like surface antigen